MKQEDTSSFSWANLNDRLAAAQSAWSRRFSPGTEDRIKILQKRALALASYKEEHLQENRDVIEVMEFSLSSERFAIETRYLREILPLREYTPLPHDSSIFFGLMNIRGQVRLVLDLKRLFDVANRGLSDRNKVIILDAYQVEIGILADAITGIRRIPAEDLEQVPASQGISQSGCARALTSDAVVLIDVEKLLKNEILVRE